MAKNYNIKLIKIKRSYSPNEIVKLFGVDRRTCSRWIKDEGLKVIKPNTNPLLIMGIDLKDFMARKQKERKTKLKDNEYFCVKCQKAVRAKAGTEKIMKTGKRLGKNNIEQINKIGLCGICGAKLNRFSRV